MLKYMQLLDINSIFIVFGKKDIYIIADRHAYNLRKLCQKINFITKIIIKKSSTLRAPLKRSWIPTRIRTKILCDPLKNSD